MCVCVIERERENERKEGERERVYVINVCSAFSVIKYSFEKKYNERRSPTREVLLLTVTSIDRLTTL